MENNEELQQQPVEQQEAEVFEGREEEMAASAAEIRAYAREALRGKWGYGIIVWLLAMLLDTLFSLPVYLANDEGLFDDIWNIISTGFSWCMWFGIMACFLDIVRKQPKSYKQLPKVAR